MLLTAARSTATARSSLIEAGGDLRRRRDDLHSPMAFVRFGPSLVEVVQSDPTHPTRIWGLVAVVEDFSELPADLIGEPRNAVQPGRRIVTVRPEAGLETAVAFMTPRATGRKSTERR